MSGPPTGKTLHPVRVMVVEYGQNLPVLVGLMAAMGNPVWPNWAISCALGAFGTALVINLTEPIKLNRPVPFRLGDLVANTAAFLAGLVLLMLYLVYVRPTEAGASSGWAVVVDAAVGLLLGFAGGLAQAVFVDERKINADSLRHAGGLALAAGVVMALLGTLYAVGIVGATPLIAALLLCIPMTLIIVRFDYWDRFQKRPD